MHNLPPNETQLSAINKLIEQQQSIITNTQSIKKENERILNRLSNEALTLERTLSSTKRLQEMSLQMSSQTTNWIRQVSTEISVQEVDRIVVSLLLPTTETFIKSWGEVEISAITFCLLLQKHTPALRERIDSIVIQLRDTETLRDETAHTITVLSTIIEAGQRAIEAKRRGILHPLRRLPAEILLQNFEECVEDEKAQLRQVLPATPGLPRILLTLASVCRRWRLTIIRTPHLWSYIRVPAKGTVRTGYTSHIRYTGTKHFKHFLSNSQRSALELTVPMQSKAVDFKEMNVDHLNLADVGSSWPPSSDMPSPLYLWMGYNSTTSISRPIPSRLLSRTTHVTCFNVTPQFEAPVEHVTSLCLEGTQSMVVPVTRLLENLPRLQHLDMLKFILGTQAPSTSQQFYDCNLSSLLINTSALSILEQSLSDGLRLLSVRQLVLSGLTGHEHLPSNFPTLSTQLKVTVTQLEFITARSPDCIRAWIDSFNALHTVATWGDDINDVLDALYSAGDWLAFPPNPRSIPRGVKRLIIREYKQDGTKISPHLINMRVHSDPETGPIDILFDGCVNITPPVRIKLLEEPAKKPVNKPANHWPYHRYLPLRERMSNWGLSHQGLP